MFEVVTAVGGSFVADAQNIPSTAVFLLVSAPFYQGDFPLICWNGIVVDPPSHQGCHTDYR